MATKKRGGCVSILFFSLDGARKALTKTMAGIVTDLCSCGFPALLDSSFFAPAAVFPSFFLFFLLLEGRWISHSAPTTILCFMRVEKKKETTKCTPFFFFKKSGREGRESRFLRSFRTSTFFLWTAMPDGPAKRNRSGASRQTHAERERGRKKRGSVIKRGVWGGGQGLDGNVSAVKAQGQGAKKGRPSARSGLFRLFPPPPPSRFRLFAIRRFANRLAASGSVFTWRQGESGVALSVARRHEAWARGIRQETG